MSADSYTASMLEDFPWIRLSQAMMHYLIMRGQKKTLRWGLFRRGLGALQGRWNPFSGFWSNAPLMATVSLTSRCPLSCGHCSENDKKAPDPSRTTLQKTFEALEKLGTPVIALTGGEPFVRSDLAELVESIPASTTVMIYTSGMGVSRALVEKLSRFHNLIVCVSIDHSLPEVHDRIRGVSGSHHNAQAALELFRATPLELHVSSLVTKERILSGEIHDFVKHFSKHSIDCIQLFGPRPVGRLAGQREVGLARTDERHLLEISKILYQDSEAPMMVAYPVLESSEFLGCCAGYARLHVDSLGNVCPCDFCPISFGNIQQEPLGVIWERMRAFFDRPSKSCMTLRNWQLFASPHRKVLAFSDIKQPERLSNDPPRIYREFGKNIYRWFLASLSLTAYVSSKWGSGQEK